MKISYLNKDLLSTHMCQALFRAPGIQNIEKLLPSWNLHSNEGQCTTQKPGNQYRARYAMKWIGSCNGTGVKGGIYLQYSEVASPRGQHSA